MTNRRRTMIAGNWKMNGITSSLTELSLLRRQINHEITDIVICPPSTLLLEALKTTIDSRIKIGAQNCHHEKSGAFTGEISAKMLKDIGVELVILGHSERRVNNFETNTLVSKKAQAAHQFDLTTIICVGESQEEKTRGQTSKIIQQQISESLPESSTAKNTVVAYEPIWAIGTGNIPTTSEILGAHTILRDKIESMKGKAVSSAIRILYGGSVTEKNCAEILNVNGVDGALVGGASLTASSFSQIIDEAKKYV